jgi:Sporulation and spore germination
VAEWRPMGAVALGLALLALAGCSVGVPRTGEVTTVSRIDSPNQRDLPGGRVANRPPPGLKPTELVREYLRVASSGDPEVARPWVVANADTTARLDAWTKRPSAWVYDNPTLKPVGPARKGEATVVMAASMIGRFDGRDWTPLAEERSLEFKLRKVGTEWRIAYPDDELWMSEEDFKERFRRMTLFMVSGSEGRQLVPAPTFFDQRAPGSGAGEDGIESQAEEVLRLLLEGPRGRLEHGLETAIPLGTRLESFSYVPSSGLATVDLSSEFTAPGGPGSGGLRVAQLVWTITELIRTAQVQIQVDGRQVETVGPDGFRLDRPYRGSAEELRALWPRRAGSGTTVAFVRRGQVYTVPIDDPAAKPRVLPLPSGQLHHPVWSPGGDRIAYLIDAGQTNDVELTTATAAGTEMTRTGLRGELSEPTWVPAEPDRLLTLKRVRDRVELWSVTPGSDDKPVRLSLGELPDGLEPSLLRVSPDGGRVLAVMHSRQRLADRDQVSFGNDSGQLYLGVLGAGGVKRWVAGPLAPGQGDAHSPVWADPETIAFIGEGGAKGSRALWTIRVDGWDPTQVLASDRSDANAVDIADQLTVDPRGKTLVFKSSTDLSSSLWLVNVNGRDLRALTPADSSILDSDPNLASG